MALKYSPLSIWEKKNPNNVYNSNMRFPLEGITFLFVIQHSEETSLGFALYED